MFDEGTRLCEGLRDGSLNQDLVLLNSVHFEYYVASDEIRAIRPANANGSYRRKGGSRSDARARAEDRLEWSSRLKPNRCKSVTPVSKVLLRAGGR